MALHGPTGEAVLGNYPGLLTLRLPYRVRQFWAVVSTHREAVDDSALAEFLNPNQRDWFHSMPASGQAHAHSVFRALQRAGHSETPLLQAALLHDLGKSRGNVQVWHRVVAVILRNVRPSLLHRLAANEPKGWRFPFYVQLHHAAMGAEVASQIGADALAVALIRWHHDAPGITDLDGNARQMLSALQRADEQH